MPISTDSIIHYTKKISSLRSILKEGFKIKYCAEDLQLSPTNARSAHPMISFCDIPLSNSQQHFGTYGYYGIGLSKSWAIRNGINPVIYVDKNSRLARAISELLIDQRSKDLKFTKEQNKNIVAIKGFAKNYEGPLSRGTTHNLHYRFYDEREWRLVPTNEQIDGKSFAIGLKRYNDNKDRYNDPLKSLRFTFDVADISYIIVKKTKDIPNIINYLRNLYRDRCNAEELDILFSKVCSTEQIISDF